MSGAKPGAGDLSALVGSRICHDLVNPLGAIGNGLELLHLAHPGESPELDLMDQAVQSAQGRLDLYRLAFGAAQVGDIFPPDRLHRLLVAGFAIGSTDLALDPLDLSRRGAKALALALLCLDAALPRGGRIVVSTGKHGLHLWAQGQIRPLPDQWQMLNDPPQTMPPPGMVQFMLLGEVLDGAPPRRSETDQDIHLGLPHLD